MKKDVKTTAIIFEKKEDIDAMKAKYYSQDVDFKGKTPEDYPVKPFYLGHKYPVLSFAEDYCAIKFFSDGDNTPYALRDLTPKVRQLKICGNTPQELLDKINKTGATYYFDCFEVRVYVPERSVSILYRYKDTENNYRYFMPTKSGVDTIINYRSENLSYYRGSRIHSPMQEMPFFYADTEEDLIQGKGKAALFSGYYSYDNNNKKFAEISIDYMEVTSEEEVKKMASCKLKRSIFNMMPYTTFYEFAVADDNGFIPNVSCVAMTSKINQFFESKGFTKDFLSKCTSYCFKDYLDNFLRKSTGDSAKRTMQDKAELAKEKLKNFLADITTREGDVDADTIYWKRDSEEISILRYIASSNFFLYSYNLNTKKSSLAKNCSTVNSSISICVPSQSMLYSTINYGNGKCNSKILGVTEDQLFAGTNVEWLRANAPQEVQEQLKELTPQILVSTGIPVLELLLKARLFNLYISLLSTNTVAHPYYCPIGDSNKKSQDHAHITFDSKGKNLKEMFGMPMNSIKKMDEIFGNIDRDNQKIGAYSWRRRKVPKFEDFFDFIGLKKKDCTPQHLDLISEILEKGFIVNPSNFTDSIPHDDRLSYFYSDTFAEVFKNKTPKERLEYLLKYAEMNRIPGEPSFVTEDDSLRILKDYLVMRKKAEGYGKDPEIAWTFNEKRYPLMPKTAYRFFPLMGRMSEDNLRAMVHSDYRSAWRNGRTAEVRLPNGKLQGIGVIMNNRENLRFLHDELSYAISKVHNPGSESRLKTALSTLKGEEKEWKDVETGLEIVLPTSLSDFYKEGETLEHCVASYVDAVSNGESEIYFIRRSDMPDSPYFTLEKVGDQIGQVHGFHNCGHSYSDQREAYRSSKLEVYNKDYDIVKFIKNWQAAKKAVTLESIREMFGT